MYTMNVVWTGSCDSLVAARDKAVSAIKSADGLSASLSIVAPGANNTIKQLGDVRSLAQQVDGKATIAVTAGGVGEAQGQLRDLRRDVNGAASDLKSGLSLNVGGSAGALQLANNLSTATGAFADTSRGASDFAGQLGGVQRVAADTNARMRSVTASANEASSAFDGYSGNGAVMSGMNSAMADSAGQAAGQMELQSSQVATLTRGLDGAGEAYRGLGADMSSMTEQSVRSRRAMGMPDPWTTGISVASGEELGIGIPDTGHGPPKPPPWKGYGGGGSGGGGFGGFGDLPGMGEGEGGVGLGEMSGAAMPLAMGAAVGVVESLGTAAIGAMAVNAAISHTPALAYAANEAMQQFSRGVTLAAANSVAQGVPAFQQLGQALRPLGEEVGTIGAKNMAAVLGGATRLAGDATAALHTLEPAFTPAINGAVALGEALINGVNNPAVVDAVNSVSNVLQNPQNENAISKTVTGILVGAAGVVSGLSDVGSDLGTVHGPTSDNQQMGQWMQSHTNGLLSYNPSLDYGWTGAPLPGQGTGVGWNQQQPTGRWATAVGSLFHAGGVAVEDAVNGSFLPSVQNPFTHGGNLVDASRANPQNWQDAKNDVSTRMSNAIHGTPGTGPAGLNQQQPQSVGFPDQTAPGKYGWQVDQQGNLQPNNVNTGQKAPQTGSPTYIPKGPGSSGLGMSASDVNQLTAAMNTASPSMSNFARNTTQATQQLSQMPQQAQNVAPPLQNLHQSMSQAAQSTQQFQQQVPQTSQAVRQLPQAVAPAMQSLQQMPQMAMPAIQSMPQQMMQTLSQMPQQAAQQLQQAHQAVQQQSQQIGQQVPQSMGQGIQQNTGAACNAAADLSANAKKCAGDAMGAASPAKDFIQLGLWAGEGLQIGLQQGTPGAAAAAGAMAASTVGSAAGALGTASPSTQFQALGQSVAGAVPQMATAANGITGQLNTLNQAGRSLNPALLGPTGALGTLNAYTAGLRTTADQHAYAARQMASNSDQLTGALSPDGGDSYKQAQKLSEDQWRQQREQQLQRHGWTQNTENNVLNREQAHNERAQQLKRQMAERQAVAMYGSRYGLDKEGLGRTLYENALRDSIKTGLPMPKTLPSPQKALHDTAMNAYRRQQEMKSPQNQLHNTLADMTKAVVHGPDVHSPNGMEPPMRGDQVGKDYVDAISRGVDVNNGKVKEAAAKNANGMINMHKKKLGINSPSTVMAQIGADTAAGLVQGLASASGGVQGVASNTGLQVGYVWGQSMVSGALSVIKSADFTTAAVSGVGSQLAETALGQLNLLGPAGSGGEIYKSPAVTLGLSSSSTTPQVNATINVSVDGTPMNVIAQNVVEANITGLANAISMQ